MSGIAGSLLSFLLFSRYGALFLVVFSASVIVPIPANVVLVGTGAFASQGYFSFTACVSVAVAAAVAGDCLDFLLAKYYGKKILRTLKVRMPLFLRNIERYLSRYPALTVIISRFGGVTDSPISLLSGLSDMPFRSFLIFDIAGNLLSQSAFLYAGYVLGASWSASVDMVHLFGWIIGALVLALLVIIALSYRSNVPRR